MLNHVNIFKEYLFPSNVYFLKDVLFLWIFTPYTKEKEASKRAVIKPLSVKFRDLSRIITKKKQLIPR